MYPLSNRKARLMAEAIECIFSGTNWLSAEEVVANFSVGSSVDSQPPQCTGVTRLLLWKNEGKIFALQKDGTDWYARYQFDGSFHPLPVMKAIVMQFADAPPVEIAAWMESPNNYLDGKRPRELAQKLPDAVLQALRCHFDRFL
jgi:hypothetical protein